MMLNERLIDQLNDLQSEKFSPEEWVKTTTTISNMLLKDAQSRDSNQLIIVYYRNEITLEKLNDFTSKQGLQLKTHRGSNYRYAAIYWGQEQANIDFSTCDLEIDVTGRAKEPQYI